NNTTQKAFAGALMFLSMEKTFMKTTNESNAMNQHHEPQAQSAGSDACRAEVVVGFPEQVGGQTNSRG
uniref:hypothetical protein n=1 Tax=Escherichia coli TaxID=562 RepID=UPI001BC8584C